MPETMKTTDDFFTPDNAVMHLEHRDLSRPAEYIRPAASRVRRHLPHRLSAIVSILILALLPVKAVNIVSYTVSDSVAESSEKLEMHYRSLSNDDNRTRICFELKSANTPFTIYKAEWVNCDSVYSPPGAVLPHSSD